MTTFTSEDREAVYKHDEPTHIVDSGASVMPKSEMITIKIVHENPDGSADAIVDYDDAGLKLIVQYGIIAMLKEAIEYQKGVATFQQGEKKKCGWLRNLFTR